MKLAFSFPGCLRVDASIGLALLLMVLQLATGTTPAFAELTFLAVVFAILAVNLAGGLSTVAGLCFAIMASQVFVVAEVAKVLCGEPGQSRLEAPLVTIGVLALSMASLCLGVLVCAPFKPRSILFRPTFDPELLRVMAVLAFLIGVGTMMGGQFAGETEDGAVRLGGVAGVFRRFSSCVPLAVICGTAYSLLTTQGKRLFTLYNAVPLLVLCSGGVFHSSKQGMFEPIICLVLTAMAFGFTWRPAYLVIGAAGALLVIFVLFPYAQVARNHTQGLNSADTLRKNIEYFKESVKNPSFFRDQHEEYKEGLLADDGVLYFNKPNGALERMSLIKPADALIHATLKQGTSGWETIGPGLADLLPRAILPRRWVNVPNQMGYKAGFLDEENLGTFVSFGFAADAFNSFGWAGVAIIPFFLGILIVLVTRFLTPAIPNNVWGIFFLTNYQHVVAEASVGGVLGLFITQTAWVVASLVLVVFASKLWLSFIRGRQLIRSRTTPFKQLG